MGLVTSDSEQYVDPKADGLLITENSNRMISLSERFALQRNRLIRSTIFAATLTFAGSLAADDTNRLNFVVISIDDLKDIIGILEDEPGNFLNTIYPDSTKRAQIRELLTPNIDRLAGESVVFTDAHTIYPICNPSRIALWTGTRPNETGLDTNDYVSFRNRPGLADIETMQQNLRQNGYFTTGLGKVFHSPRGGVDEELSWDQWINRLQGARGPWIPSTYSAGSSTWPFGESPFPLVEQYDYINADHVARLLEDGASSLPNYNSNVPVSVQLPATDPFMIGLGIYLPHKPFVAPTEVLALFDVNDMGLNSAGLSSIFTDLNDLSDRGLFLANANSSGSTAGPFRALLDYGLSRDGVGGDVAAWKEIVKHYLASMVVADRSVGRVLDALDTGPYANNTVVVLHSDHGYQLGEKNVLGKNTLWDDATRSVLMFRVPGIAPKRVSETVYLQDIYPTVSALAGIETPDHVRYKDLSPLIHNLDAVSTQPVFSMQGRFRANRFAIVTERYRYLRFGNGLEDAELYDRYADPDDIFNLIDAPDHQHIRETMNLLLENALVLEDGPPVILPVQNRESAIGEGVHFSISAWHALGDELLYEATGLPSGLSIDLQTGTILGSAVDGGVYDVEVIVRSSAGETSSSFQWSVVEPDLLPPSWSEASIHQLAVSSRTIDIDWVGAFDAVGIVGYKLYYRTENSIPGEAFSTDSDFQLINLEPDTEYFIEVEALDAAGNISDDGPIAILRTEIEDFGPPVWNASSSASFSELSNDSVFINWPVAIDDNEVVGYRVEVDAEGINVLSLTTSQTSIALSDLVENTRYNVTIVAWDLLDKVSLPITTTFRTTISPDEGPPNWVNGTIEIVKSSDVEVDLVWSSATDDTGVVDYVVTIINQSSPDLSTFVSSHTGTSAVIAGLASSSAYEVSVQARDATGAISSDGPSAIFTTAIQSIPSTELVLTIDGVSRSESIQSFSSQDRGPGTTELSTNGDSISLYGNVWKRVRIDYDLTSDSILEFDFTGINEGEVHGIGFETDNFPSSSTVIKLWGTEQYGITDLASYSGNSVQRFRIPIGERLLARHYQWLTLIGDHDRLPRDSAATFSTIKLYSSPISDMDITAPQWSSQQLEVINVTDSSALLNWSTATDTNSSVSYSVSLNGQVISETENTDFEITGLLQATAYIIEVEAYDQSGNRSQPISIQILTESDDSPPDDTTPPLWSAGNIQATLIGSGRVSLAWPTATDSDGSVEYEVFLESEIIENTSEVSLIVEDLLPETSYTFFVVAIDQNSNRSAPLSIALTTNIDPIPTDGSLPIAGAIYVSSSSNGRVSGITFADEDIIVLNETTDSWEILFDGSDVGILGDIDAFVFTPSGDLLLSVDSPTTLASIGRIDDSDILRFEPSNLGEETAGTLTMFFDGSDVGLTQAGEDINALALSPDGELLVSVVGRLIVGDFKADDEDLVRFVEESYGENTVGGWEMFLDGSDVGLAGEDIWGASSSEMLSLTLQNSFASLSGHVAAWDIFSISVLNPGSSTSASINSELVLDGLAEGLQYETINAIHFDTATTNQENMDVVLAID